MKYTGANYICFSTLIPFLSKKIGLEIRITSS